MGLEVRVKVGDKVRLQDWVFTEPLCGDQIWIKNFQDCVGVVCDVSTAMRVCEVFWFSPSQGEKRYAYGIGRLFHLGSFLDGVDVPEVEVERIIFSGSSL
jgi:hypothetical protein